MSESMRDRLLTACQPTESKMMSDGYYSTLFNAPDEILARVLAVLADPDEATVESVHRGLVDQREANGKLDRVCAYAAIAALAEHLGES